MHVLRGWRPWLLLNVKIWSLNNWSRGYENLFFLFSRGLWCVVTIAWPSAAMGRWKIIIDLFYLRLLLLVNVTKVQVWDTWPRAWHHRWLLIICSTAISLPILNLHLLHLLLRWGWIIRWCGDIVSLDWWLLLLLLRIRSIVVAIHVKLLLLLLFGIRRCIVAIDSTSLVWWLNNLLYDFILLKDSLDGLLVFLNGLSVLIIVHTES
jgi:hypothetical protein